MLRFYMLAPLLAIACSSPTHPAEPLMSDASALSKIGEPCEIPRDCIPSEKDCGVVLCTGNICKIVPIATDSPCASGAGTCDDVHVCHYPAGPCKGWVGPGLRACDDDSECDDKTPCTLDKCEYGYCYHEAINTGVACGPDIVCDRGLCCVP